MIKTLDGNTIGKVDDSMNLTEEQVERFKQENKGMTPEEYAMKQAELAIMYGYRRELADIIQEVVRRDISYSEICEEVIVKKCSKLRATVRNFIKVFGQTDEAKALIQRIIDKQVEILAKQAEEAKKKEQEENEKNQAENKSETSEPVEAVEEDLSGTTE